VHPAEKKKSPKSFVIEGFQGFFYAFFCQTQDSDKQWLLANVINLPSHKKTRPQKQIPVPGSWKVLQGSIVFALLLNR
ncbi:hypothetical protein, partial [Anoxynatronum buryatiense]|uniref:hypothetical protein n=1 Tax=Anoxynatronum buryatiense TaxID=489973 RepID=UPI0024B6EA03